MKRIILTFAFLLTASAQVCPQPVSPLTSQGGWFWQNPLPQGNTINDVDFLDDSFGIAVGKTGTIIKSENGGLTWCLKESNTIEHIYKIEVTSGEVAYALGRYFILKTTDSGESWFNIPVPTSNYLNDFYFIDELKGYVVGSGVTIYITEDGGNNWISINTGLTGILTSIHFLNENFGITIGYNLLTSQSIILKTTDGGLSWLDFSFSSPFVLGNSDLFILSELKIYIVNNLNFIHSSDGGVNWNWTSMGGSNSYLLSIEFYDTLKGIITSVDKIFKTSDGGNSWQVVPMFLGSNIWLYGLTYPSEDFMLTAGLFGRMAYSENEGNNWTNLSSGSIIDFNDVAFYDELHGIAVGGGSAVTTNGGQNWITTQGGNGFRCSMPSKTICFSAGGYNLTKSTDGGFTWNRHPISDNNYFMTVSFVDTMNGVATTMLGSQPKIFRTFDGGENWQHITTLQDSYIYDVCFVDSVTIYASGNGGIIYKSIDGGYDWLSLPTGYGNILYGIHFLDNWIGYVAGNSRTILKTTDGGLNWTIINSGIPTGLDFKQVHFFDESNGLVFGESVAHTTDGGETWQTYKLVEDFIMSGTMINDSVWYAVGQFGTILKYNSGAVIPVELISFNAVISINEIKLNWQTAAEKNNQGFSIERKFNSGEWKSIGFVEGQGTTTEENHYTFIDDGLIPGIYHYRLKQIDFDGTFEYSNEIEVEVGIPDKFSLSQNYPNPFNPSTKISWQSPVISHQVLKVFDVLGREVATLVDEYRNAGYHEVEFNAAGLSSGVYFYRIQAGDYVETKKMVLIR